MTYLILQIWVFLIAACFLGLVIGAVARGGSGGARVRDLTRRLAEAESEAQSLRMQATRTGAAAQSAPASADVAKLREQLAEANTARERHADEVAQLRQTLAEREERSNGEPNAAHLEDIDRLNAEVARLQAALDVSGRATEPDAASDQLRRAQDEAETLRLRFSEIDAELSERSEENDELRARVEELEIAAIDADRLAEHVRELEPLRVEAEELRAEVAQLRPVADEVGQMRSRLADAEIQMAAADGLRERLNQLEPMQNEAESARRRVAELEPLAQEVDDLRARLASAGDATSEAQTEVDGLRRRIAELELVAEETEGLRSRAVALEPAAEEVEHLRARVAELEPMVDELADARARLEQTEAAAGAAQAVASEADGLRNRVAELEGLAGQAVHDRERAQALQAELTALETGDEAAFTKGDPARQGQWQATRIRWLERALVLARNGEPLPAPPEQADAAELEALRARVAELQGGDGADAGADEEPGEGASDASRLRWRNRYLASRVKYLEGRLSGEGEGEHSTTSAEPEPALLAGDERTRLEDEIARLRARVGELEAGASEEGDGEPQSLEWRNRYLASRVRFLEQRLGEAEAEAAGRAPHGGDDIAGGDDEVRADAARLRARVEELEQALAENTAQAAPDSEDRDGEYALEWRNRYLTSRVKYLEERLAEAQGAPVESD